MKIFKHIYIIYSFLHIALSATLAMASVEQATAQSRIRITEPMLMHEERITPLPADGSTVSERKVSFQWPTADNAPFRYRLRYSQDSHLATACTERETFWPMYNPDTDLAPGMWYWRYGYVSEDGSVKWSDINSFKVVQLSPTHFCPPPFSSVVEGLPDSHPRILTTRDTWNSFALNTKGRPERKWYIDKAQKVMRKPMKSTADIATSKLSKLTNAVQRKAYLTRESRRIIDGEESGCNALVFAYLLTRDVSYAHEATRRIITMVDWDKDVNVKGDFNDASLLSLCTMAYDSFYDVLTTEQRTALLQAIDRKAGKMYALYNNHLENYIADNHVWQMTLRILTMAALSTYGELPRAAMWAEYCYNVWVARMPGLNTDGAWHNGDSYFMVNCRTLIEVPWLYSRLTGYDFFCDPWYRRNIMYTIFEQPPFSKSGGNGSSHQRVLEPSATRIGYLDALVRLTGDTYAADFVRRTLAVRPDYLKRSFLGKSGDLAWFRLQCQRPLPEGVGLDSLPSAYVFPESGLAAFHTDWTDWHQNAMLTFRSSPYGSTSHALANQNAFNTFYGGQPLFYSSGHHTSFVDRHSILCHRATRAHNTILVDGMGQRIGTEGYGWIPRYYTGSNVNYVLGDASNAYGEVVSPLWTERLRKAGVETSPRTGWDVNHLATYRRHIVELGTSGLVFVYDELEADRPVVWSYMLHTVLHPMTIGHESQALHVRAINYARGVSDAWLYASTALTADTTSQFFVPADNWLKGDADGRYASNPNHWHFTASTAKTRCCHFATIIDTHSADSKVRKPRLTKDGTIHVADWTIRLNLKADGRSFFSATNSKTGTEVTLSDRGTFIRDAGHTEILVDHLPQLEI